MGIGKDRLGNTYSVTYHDGTGNIRGATYASITTQGHLNLIDSNFTPTAPSTGKIIIFAEDYAGRVLPSVIGPSGVDYVLQSALYGNTNYVWLPGTAATIAENWGSSWTARNSSGIQSHPIKSPTSSMTSMNRAAFNTGLATGSSGIQSSVTAAWLGNSAGLGGFLFFARFGLESILGGGNYNILVGLSALNGNLAGESSAQVNTIALGKDTGDSTWWVMTRDGTTGNNKINTFITVTAGQILDLYIHTAPNSSSVKFYIKNGATGADLYTSPTPITTGLPLNTTFMYMHTQLRSTSVANTKVLALNVMYLETDL